MKYLTPILALTASPALAHVQPGPHLHGNDVATWTVAALIAAGVALHAIRKG